MIEFKYLATRSGKSLILSMDNRKYLFNLFEGFQRYCVEARVSLSKITSIFMSSIDSIPPFIGTYLTLRDMGRECVDVVCDPSLHGIIESAKSFADPMNMKINCMTRYTDDLIKIEPIINRVMKNNVVRNEVSYILDINPIRGKFLVDLVPKEIPKYLYSKLIRRMSIEYNRVIYNGNEYIDDDVDVGSIGIIYSSGNYEELLRMIEGRELRYIFCFQAEVMEFMMSSLEGTYFLLEDNFFVEYGCLYNIQVELNSICDDFLLPLPIDESEHSNRVISSRSLQSCDTMVYNKDSRDFIHSSVDHQVHIKHDRREVDRSILFLGTGCAVPSKYRNVSVILYESPDRAMLLDCGEDALFQIHRAHGNLDVLKKITTIFLSHSHADHVLGVISILKEMKHRVRILGPSVIGRFISLFDLDHEFIETNDAKTLERRFMSDGNRDDVDIRDYVLEFNGEFRIMICGVDHCPDSCGIRVQDDDTVISYSGDSRPSLLFGMMSSNSNVMIHEATFASDQHKRAIQTGHSTIEGAIGVFKTSKSNTLLLTHFSQRYSKDVVSDGDWIPCVDLFRYVIGSSYPRDEINEYYSRNNE